MSDIQLLEKKYQENPSDVEVCLDLGIAYGQEENYKKAIQILQKATKLAPDNPDTHYNLAVAYGIVFIDDIEVDEIWEDQTDEEELFELAINSYQKALDIDPDFIEAHNNIGTLYVIQEMGEKAIKHWEKSLELDPDQDDIREELEDLKNILDDDEDWDDKEEIEAEDDDLKDYIDEDDDFDEEGDD